MAIHLHWDGDRPVLGDISDSPLSLAARGSPSFANIVLSESFPSSPEEQIIRQRSRGRRSLQPLDPLNPIAYCLGDWHRQSLPWYSQITPAKDDLSHLPRKRLQLSPPNRTSTPSKTSKRRRLSTKSGSPLKSELQGYSSEQLAKVLDTLVTSHPELEKEVRNCLTVPDLRPLEDTLNSLRKSILRALPSRRFSSSRDAHCYQRCKPQLNAFKKACVRQCKVLVDATCWESVVRYVILAWHYVHQLPVFDESSHNVSRGVCFSSLATYCSMALTQGHFSQKLLQNFKPKLAKASLLCSELAPCVEQAEQLLQENNNNNNGINM